MKKIKILYDASILNQFNSGNADRSGIYWTAYNMLCYLSKNENLKIYLYSVNYSKTQNFLSAHQDKLPYVQLYDGDVKEMDLVFSPCHKINENIRQTGIPCYTLLHDCIPLVLPEYFDNTAKSWFINLFNSLNEKEYYFANSNYTKQDFLKFCPALDKDKITVIPLSTNIEYKPNKDKVQLEKAKQKYHIPQNMKYIFSLCSLEPRKNLIRAVRTFIKFIEKNKINDMVFVLGGSAWNGFIEKFEKEVPEYAKYKNKIIRAGYVDDEDLEILYSNAEWFVYTSQYEGFGMPPLEAMACGCPVITSNNSSLPEVVGNAGIMIDWDSDEQHISAYEKYYFDAKYRQTMAQKGLKQATKFSWQKAADIMVETFQKTPQVKNRTSLILQKPGNNNDEKIISVKLFNFIPLFKIYSSPHKKKYKFCGFIPLYSRKQFGGRKIFEFFGIPFFKIRKMPNGITTKYYFLNLPILKISRK
jgi:glycosyltransferase involved in cell wall biosynthesis